MWARAWLDTLCPQSSEPHTPPPPPQRVSRVPESWEWGKINGPLFVGFVLLLLILVSVLLFSTWIYIRRGIVTVVSAHPARRCTSPLGVVPVGLGDGVGDCHDVANLPRKRSFYFPFVFLWGKNFTLFLRVWFLIFVHC